jgi:hypothetical protein
MVQGPWHPKKHAPGTLTTVCPQVQSHGILLANSNPFENTKDRHGVHTQKPRLFAYLIY